jgi:hypothetical protein
MHACVYFCTVSLALFGGMLTCSQALPVETVPMERLESAVDEDRYACTPTAHLSSLESPLLIGWLSRSTWSQKQLIAAYRVKLIIRWFFVRALSRSRNLVLYGSWH